MSKKASGGSKAAGAKAGGVKRARRSRAAASSPAVAPAEKKARRRLAQWLQLGLFQAPPPAEPPEVRVPPRLRSAVGHEQARRLAARLSARLPMRLASLTVTDNRSVLLSTTPHHGGLKVRLHRAFVEADRNALDAAAVFAGGARGEIRREALARLRAHVDAWRDGNRRAELQRPRPATFPRGAWHDLAAIRDSLGARWFAGRLKPAITWGRWSTRGRRRTIRLGSYDARDNLIRVHPALDQPWVPRMFLHAVVYHEMLHADMPPHEGGLRRCLHSAEFRRREKLLPGYDAAEAWLATNVHRLVKSRPRR